MLANKLIEAPPSSGGRVEVKFGLVSTVSLHVLSELSGSQVVIHFLSSHSVTGVQLLQPVKDFEPRANVTVYPDV